MPRASSSGSTRSSRSAARPAPTGPGLGEGEQRAFELVAGWMREAGLDVDVRRGRERRRPAAGSEPDLPEVWSGSHLDTPPDGGRFDGALGTLLALDAAEAIARRRPPRRTRRGHGVPARGGPRFGRGDFGSRAVCGTLDDDEGELRRSPTASRSPRRSRRSATASCLRTAGSTRRRAAFVEAHIEQGPTLAARGRAARDRHVDRRHGRPRARVHRPARPRGHGADGAAIRCARRRRALRRRRSRRRPRAARRGRDDRPHDGRARRDEHDPRARASCSPTCARPTTSGVEALVDGGVRPRARRRRSPAARSRSSRAGATRRSP